MVKIRYIPMKVPAEHNRPKSLPIKVLREHVRHLLKKSSSKVKFVKGKGDVSYDILSDKLVLPQITCGVTYILALHEIGHSKSMKLRRTGQRYIHHIKRLKQLREKLKSVGRSDSKYRAIKEEILKLELQLRVFVKRQTDPNRVVSHETDAWKFAYKTAKVWNKSCSKILVDGMGSYFFSLMVEPMWTVRAIEKESRKFFVKFLRPIFTE